MSEGDRGGGAAPGLGRIAIVDDEIELMTALCELLEAQGYEAKGFTSGPDALEALRDENFDLLLSDLSMPDMDGISLVSAALEIDPLIVAIMMTGQGSVQTAVEAMRVGAFDYLLKPFKLSAVLPVLARCMDVRRLKIENVQLRETVAIHELSKAVSMTLDLDSILQKVLDAAVQQCQADEASILLPTRDGAELYIAAIRGTGRERLLGQRVPFAKGVAGWVAEHLEPLTLTGEVQDARFTPARPRPEIRSAVSMPMLVGGKLVGILNVSTLQRRPFTLGQVKALSILTTTGAAALQHTSLYIEAREAEERSRGMAERLAAVNEFSRTITSTLDPKSVFGVVLDRVANLTHCTWCRISQFDPEAEGFHVAASWTIGEGVQFPESDLGIEPTLVAEDAAALSALHNGQPVIVDDTRQAQAGAGRGLAERGILTVMYVPIRFNARFWGKLGVGFPELQAATPDRVEFLTAIASHLAVAVKNAELYSQLHTAYDELAQTQRRVVQQERLRALGQMASGIAHDLNNALVPALGFTELLLDRPEGLNDKQKVRDYLNLIRTSAQDAGTVVSRLREFYRPREDDETFNSVSLDEVVQKAMTLTQPRWKDQAQASGVTIQVRTDFSNPPLIFGSEAELREAVANLIFNAVDAIARSGMIALRTRSDREYAYLDVSDTGAGMPEDVRQRALEPFFSTKGERGTGLGLPMVYGIAKRHEGTVEIASEVGRGTTVTLRFPIARAASAGSSAELTSPSERKLNVLVVDDEQMVREVVSQYLRSDGHEVETAHSGADGLDRIPSGSFDLVITDRGMPEMTGDQMAAEIKKLHPELPIILLTGFGDLMRAERDQPSGVDEVVSKPVRLGVLRDAIARTVFHRGAAA